MLSLLLLAAAANALPQPDPYGPAPRAAALRLAWEAERGGAREEGAIERWLAGHPTAPAAERAMLAHRLCLNLGVLIGGERRVAACRLSVALSGDPEDKSDLAIAEAFRREPPIAASGSVTVPLARSPLGLRSVAVAANGATSDWLVDSGAEITTVPASTAARLGVRMVEGSADVGTSTTIRVQGRLGVIDRLAIGGASVAHVPVLVLPDAMLQLKDDEVIPGILGLPVLAAFGRVAWLAQGTRLALGREAVGAVGGAARVYWHESGLGVPMTTALGTRGAHLDTGATRSALSTLGLALLTPAQQAAAVERKTRTGGAGGFVEGKARVLPVLEYRVAGAAVRAERVGIDEDRDGAGTVGGDALGQMARFAVDFEGMRVEAVEAQTPSVGVPFHQPAAGPPPQAALGEE